GRIHKLTELVKDSEAQKNLAFIENEIRRLRDFTEGLGQAFDLDSRPSEEIDLSEVVNDIIAKYRKVLAKREIQIEIEPHPNAHSRINRDDLFFILNTLFDLAVHKLSYSGEQRKLQIKIDRVGGTSRVSILMVGAKLP